MKNTNHVPLGLRYAADVRSLGLLSFLLGLLIAHWTGWFRSPWSYAITFPLAFVATVIAHNHMHLGLFRNRWANEMFSIVLCFGTGQPPTGIITAHNVRHHGHCNTELDFTRCSLARFRWNWLNVLAFPFLSIRAMRREKESDLRKWRRSRSRLFRQAICERTLFYGAALTAITVDWHATLVYLVAPWLFGQLCLVGINLVQHQDCDHGSEFDHSRNIVGRFMNWFFLNNGYHTAHHMKPSLHWSLLPEYHARHVAPYMDPTLNHRSLLGAVWNRLLSTREP